MRPRTPSAPRHELTGVGGADDPYRELVKAILHRAVEDAQGRCVHPGNRAPGQIEVEARAWLQDGWAMTDLLELAGWDAEPVIRRVRRLLTMDPERNRA